MPIDADGVLEIMGDGGHRLNDGCGLCFVVALKDERASQRIDTGGGVREDDRPLMSQEGLVRGAMRDVSRAASVRESSRQCVGPKLCEDAAPD